MSDTAIIEWRDAPTRMNEPAAGFTRSGEARSGGVGPPAIRIPVTPENRNRLRDLRAREFEGWRQTGPVETASPAGYLRVPKPDREAQVILVVLGGIALTVLIQSTWVVSACVTRWDQFTRLVESLIR